MRKLCGFDLVAPVPAILCLLLAIAQVTAAADDTAGIYGTVFFDKNGNGRRDAGEPGFAGVCVVLFGHSVSAAGSEVPIYGSTRTDDRGYYSFPDGLIGQGSNVAVTTGGAPMAYALPTKYTAIRTFYAASDGNDANPGDREHPFHTIAKAVAALQPGDVLYLRQGTYRECISTAEHAIAGGKSWQQPVVVAGAPGETAVIKPPDREAKSALIELAGGQQQYLVFDNLVLDGDGTVQAVRSRPREGKEAPAHIRVINSEILHTNQTAIATAGDDHQFINCRIHDNGLTDHDDGLSIGGGHGLVQGCDIYFNAGSGIRLLSDSGGTASSNVIRGNRIHQNGVRNSACFGIALNTGAKNLVYDNVIWANPIGLVISDGGTEEMVYNNTIYRNQLHGIIMAPEPQARANVVRNNIVIRNRDPNIKTFLPAQTSKLDHNLTSGDPLFRDVDALDFHLLPNSPAVNSGETIAEVTSDFDGLLRPQGKAYCIGAYEYSDAGFMPTTSSVLDIYRGRRKRATDIGFTMKK